MDLGRRRAEPRAPRAVAQEPVRDVEDGRAGPPDLDVRRAVLEARVVPLGVEGPRLRPAPEQHGRARGPEVVQVLGEGAVRVARERREHRVGGKLRRLDAARGEEPRRAGREGVARVGTGEAAPRRVAAQPVHELAPVERPGLLVLEDRGDVEGLRVAQRERERRHADLEAGRRVAVDLERRRAARRVRVLGRPRAPAPEDLARPFRRRPRRRLADARGPRLPRGKGAKVGVRRHDAGRRVRDLGDDLCANQPLVWGGLIQNRSIARTVKSG